MAYQTDPDGNPYLFDVSTRHGYSPEQSSEINSAKTEADKVRVAKPLPSNIRVSHEGDEGAFNERGELPFYHRVDLYAHGYSLGHVSWNPSSGHVHHFEVHPDYRAYVPHLLSEAHEWADKTGVNGPTDSDNLTGYSYRVAKRHVPSFIPPDAKVHDMPVGLLGDEGAVFLHRLHGTAVRLEAEAQKFGVNPRALASRATTAEHLSRAIHHHSKQDFQAMSTALADASEEADRMTTESDHSDIDTNEHARHANSWNNLSDVLSGWTGAAMYKVLENNA
jgi:hypothetical protein